jgi:hypothetical protein
MKQKRSIVGLGAAILATTTFAVVMMMMMGTMTSAWFMVEAFVPVTHNIMTQSPSSLALSSPLSSSLMSPSPRTSALSSYRRRSGTKQQRRHPTHLYMSSSSSPPNDYFDQSLYTDAAWSAITALPPCASYYSATSVDAPMLLSILLNPTKYNIPNIDNALTAKTVVAKLLSEAGLENVDGLKKEVERYLERQPKVSGDTSTQKSLGRTLGEVLEAARGVRDGLKVGAMCCVCVLLRDRNEVK